MTYQSHPRVECHNGTTLVDINVADSQTDAASCGVVGFRGSGEFVVILEKVTFQAVRASGTPNGC